MSTTQVDVQLLKQAVRQLSREDRGLLAEWALYLPDTELRVEEAALPYGGRRYLTVEEYLKFEEESPNRHEYVAGYVYAMSRPVLRHEMIAINLVVQFQSQLRGTLCRAFGSNTKVRFKVDQDDIFYVPDLMVECGSFTENLEAQWLTSPCLIAEVLSPSTQDIDRREKALNYRHIKSLEEYLVIAQRSMEVTVFRRSDNWRPLVLTAPEDIFQSRAAQITVTLANIYEGVL